MPKLRKLSPEEILQFEAAPPDDDPTDDQPDAPAESHPLDQSYPSIAAWVEDGGWIEFGQTEYSRSFVRILDIGGMLWEGTAHFRSFGALMDAAEERLRQLEEEGGL